VKFNFIFKNIFVVSALFFFTGIVSTVYFLEKEDNGFLSLYLKGKPEQLVIPRDSELLQGDIVKGSFLSKYNYLNSIHVRFYRLYPSSDKLIFRLKQESYDGWIYQKTFDTKDFSSHELNSFNFPTLAFSKNKNFQFELESVSGSTGSGIIVDQAKTTFIVKSEFSGLSLLQNRKHLQYFIASKIDNLLSESGMGLKILFFFLPLILFISYHLLSEFDYRYYVGLTLGLCLLDIFVIQESYDFFLLAIFLFWSMTAYRFRFESRINAAIASVFFILTIGLTFWDLTIPTEKSIVYGFIFLVSALTTLFRRSYSVGEEMQITSFFQNFAKVKKLPTHKPISTVRYKKFLNLFIKSLPQISILVILILSITRIIDKIDVFKAFYPSDYLRIFVNTLLLPEILLFILFVAGYFYLNKLSQRKIAILFILVSLFYLFSGSIMRKSLDFENKSRITHISPNETNEAWADVSVYGKNFRGKPFVGKILIDGVEQGVYVIDWSDERVIFRTSPEITKSGLVQVVPMDRPPSNKVLFKYNFKW